METENITTEQRTQLIKIGARMMLSSLIVAIEEHGEEITKESLVELLEDI